DGPVLLPALVPLAIALGEGPKVGKSYVLPVFNPSTMAPSDARIHVTAETTFVVNDSSVLDPATKRWRGVQPDTVRAWRLQAPDEAGIGGWIDAQGRVVATTRMGFRLERRPYEVAYENWRLDTVQDSAAAIAAKQNRLKQSNLAAGRRAARRAPPRLLLLTRPR
ncbi:MAG: hypothetical protein ACRENQ_06140, partial [Gemmatimonadaceae bacterium]